MVENLTRDPRFERDLCGCVIEVAALHIWPANYVSVMVGNRTRDSRFGSNLDHQEFRGVDRSYWKLPEVDLPFVEVN